MRTVIQAVADQLAQHHPALDAKIADNPDYYMTKESVAARLNIALRQFVPDEERLDFVSWLFKIKAIESTKELTLAQGNAIARSQTVIPAAYQEWQQEKRYGDILHSYAVKF